MARKPKTQPNPEAATATPVEELAAMDAVPASTRQGRPAGARSAFGDAQRQCGHKRRRGGHR